MQNVLVSLVAASLSLAAVAREWEDEQVNAINREAARAASFPLSEAKAALTPEEPGDGPAASAIDGSTQTIWHSRWEPTEATFPHHLTLDIGEELAVAGITYHGRSDGQENGWIKNYQVFVSKDSKAWGVPAYAGEFKVPQNSEQRVIFVQP